jgi:hypothetical protein
LRTGMVISGKNSSGRCRRGLYAMVDRLSTTRRRRRGYQCCLTTAHGSRATWLWGRMDFFLVCDEGFCPRPPSRPIAAMSSIAG